jgi:uncharacterized membrane protein
VELDYLGILFRWMHILAALTALGGSVFIRFALQPSLAELSEQARGEFQESVRRRWSKLVMASIAFLLISGLYNIAVISLRNKLPGYYMPLFGVKFLLALAIAFLASALSGRSAAFAPIRANARYWLTVNLLLALVLVGISGILRMAPRTPKVTPGSQLQIPPESMRILRIYADQGGSRAK